MANERNRDAARGGRQTGSDFGMEDDRLLVQADDRARGIVGFGIQIEDILHRGDEVWPHAGNAPRLMLPGLQLVF